MLFFSAQSDRLCYASTLGGSGVHITTLEQKERVKAVLVAQTVVHVFRNSVKITTMSSSVLRSSQPWFAFAWSNQPHFFFQCANALMYQCSNVDVAPILDVAAQPRELIPLYKAPSTKCYKLMSLIYTFTHTYGYIQDTKRNQKQRV